MSRCRNFNTFQVDMAVNNTVTIDISSYADPRFLCDDIRRSELFVDEFYEWLKESGMKIRYVSKRHTGEDYQCQLIRLTQPNYSKCDIDYDRLVFENDEDAVLFKLMWL